jgi:hypothetical protein
VVCHLVALRAAVSRCPRTYSGRDPRPGTDGAPPSYASAAATSSRRAARGALT